MIASENKLEKPLFCDGNDKIFDLKKIGQLHKIMTSIKFSRFVGYFLSVIVFLLTYST
jgi:hypothetical protein|tara:strand:- start:1189 stop:1362 length:174 start_codon:yes stop_codon:yes gene_type:complete